MHSFSDKLHTEYFMEHGDQPVLIAVDLFNWAVTKCTLHSTAKEYELLAAAYALQWNQVRSHAYNFLVKWEAHISELHAYLQVPWMPDHCYWTLKHALPSDRNALSNSVLILHEQLHGREQTAKSVANILCQYYKLVADSIPVNQHHMMEESELNALQAATFINCWACGKLGHAANRCLNEVAHAQWREEKVKVPPKNRANTLSEVAHPKPDICNRIVSITNPVKICGNVLCITISIKVIPGLCHGPGCSRSRRVTGSYGRSTGIEDLVDTSREHGRSAVSMETMDFYGLTCKGGPSHMRGGPSTAMRRTKLKEQAQPRRGPSSRSMQMVTTQGLERQEPKELSLIKGEGAVSKESTPGHKEEEQCRRS
ncbi:hypothetical protein NDA10_008083 [Ustilago hordei]|nr:hypothetical protein NDA10_008083 [Ustilago hordei]